MMHIYSVFEKYTRTSISAYAYPRTLAATVSTTSLHAKLRDLTNPSMRQTSYVLQWTLIVCFSVALIVVTMNSSSSAYMGRQMPKMMRNSTRFS